MLDEDLKKLLREIKSENGPNRARSSWRRGLLYSLGAASLVCMALYLCPVQELQTPQTSRLLELDPTMGKDVGLLSSMLEHRRVDLAAIANELSILLNDNAAIREDFYGQRASLLITRYQTCDARYSVQIASQIDGLYKEIAMKQNRALEVAYAEMLGELGCEIYSTHQFQIAKQIIGQEMKFDALCASIAESKSLSELDANIEQAATLLASFRTDGLVNTFSSLEKYQSDLVQFSVERLNRLMFGSDRTPGSKDVLEAILQRIGATSDQRQQYLERLNQLTGDGAAETKIKPATSLIVLK